MSGLLQRLRGPDFAARLLQGVLAGVEHAANAERRAELPGPLQAIDPRAKLLSALLLIVACVHTQRLDLLAGFATLLTLLAWRSQLLAPLFRLWLGVAAFSGLLALPALFLVSGASAGTLPLIGVNVSIPGLRSAAFLLLRSLDCGGLAALLAFSTPWAQVLKSLRCLRVPVSLVVILAMTQRYLLLLLRSAVQLFEARQSRVLGPLPGRERRRLAAATAGALFSRSLQLGEEVHLAMLARGYRGEVHLLDDFVAAPRDFLATALALAAALVLVVA
jgi:cobalt/nickel transport system permease protein